jgi:large subunit ribosomal protein L17
LASTLLLKEKIKTTEAKAKEVASFVEKQITRAKIGDLTSKRLLAKYFSPEIVKKLINEIAPRYKPPYQNSVGGKERKGGYTRIIKLGSRKSDGAKMAIIELIK